jgi:hypothetical protein
VFSVCAAVADSGIGREDKCQAREPRPDTPGYARDGPHHLEQAAASVGTDLTAIQSILSRP